MCSLLETVQNLLELDTMWLIVQGLLLCGSDESESNENIHFTVKDKSKLTTDVAK